MNVILGYTNTAKLLRSNYLGIFSGANCIHIGCIRLVYPWFSFLANDNTVAVDNVPWELNSNSGWTRRNLGTDEDVGFPNATTWGDRNSSWDDNNAGRRRYLVGSDYHGARSVYEKGTLAEKHELNFLPSLVDEVLGDATTMRRVEVRHDKGNYGDQ